jgi:hypothetical protein
MPHLSDRILSDKWGVVHSGAHPVFALPLLRNRSILVPEENKKSEPFSYREKVRIFYFNGSPPGRHSYGLGTAG